MRIGRPAAGLGALSPNQIAAQSVPFCPHGVVRYVERHGASVDGACVAVPAPDLAVPARAMPSPKKC